MVDSPMLVFVFWSKFLKCSVGRGIIIMQNSVAWTNIWSFAVEFKFNRYVINFCAGKHRIPSFLP